MLAASTDASLNATYLWVYIVLGLVLVAGSGGLWGFVRWLKRQAVRDAKLDELVDPTTGVMKQLRTHGKQLEDLQRSMHPNGLDTDQIGDIAKRTERLAESLQVSLNKHLGASDEVHRAIWKELDKKMDRSRR